MAQRAKGVVGQTLGRTYRIERAIGVGSIGAVYVARHVRTGGLCAVKILHRKLAGSEAFERFIEESRVLSALRHPNIVSIMDFDRDEVGTPFLVMDLLEGENLMQRLRQKGCLPLSQAAEVLRQVGSALSAAHRSGVVHRNLKPENIFLVRHDLGDRVTETARLTDFGMARLRRAAVASLSGSGEPSLLGLSQYTAPEILKDLAAPVDGRADQWALAVITYRMLAGVLPFPGESLKEVLQQVQSDPPTPLPQLAPELPAHVVAAVARGMAKRREERFDHIMDFVRAVCDRPSGSVAVGPPPAEADAVKTPAPLPLTPQKEPRGRGLWVAGAALLVLLTAAGTALLVQRARQRQGLAVVHSAPPAPVPAVKPPEPLVEPIVVPPPPPAPAAPTLVSASPPPAKEAAQDLRTSEPPPPRLPKLEDEPPPAPLREVRREREAPPAEEAAPPPPGREGRSPEQLLKEAQDVYVEDKQQAIALALSAASQPGGHANAAWRFLATAACQVRDLKLASRAYRHLDPGDRQFVLSVCQRQGLAYLNGEFRPESWPSP